jgi:NCAIR mutase (PurE)-related protein
LSPEELKKILTDVKENNISIPAAVNKFKDFNYKDLGFARIDNHRHLRTGYAEVIYSSGKTVEQVTKIISYMLTKDHNILATRATPEMYAAVKKICPKAEYDELSKVLTIRQKKIKPTKSEIAIISAGTSDIGVAEEAALTAEIFGNTVKRYYDAGVAGVHRIYDSANSIRKARVCVVCAGMEGALPSIVGGIVDKPVIAVPTSVGYGASFGGITALLGMLTSCASGVSVVNIDNGFGAGYLASMINKL